MLPPPPVNLSPFNTLALPCQASRYLRITALEQLAAARAQPGPRFILGGGSNVVLPESLDRLVVHMALARRQLTGEDAEAWYVTAGAGENWHDFVLWTLARGWPGLENLALIPGTVGAAPIQNIGAYGLEVGERLHQVEAFDFTTGQTLQFSREECRFGYRDSLFKRKGWHADGRLAITAVTFRLPKAWQARCTYADVARELAGQQITSPSPQQVAEAIMAIRRRKLPDPATLPNAGSFFHNPVIPADTAHRLASQYPGLPCYPQPNGSVKLAAAWLIEQAGWKGRQLGPVGMYAQQALVLVNHGGGRRQDVENTMAAVQEAVLARFGVRLTPEPVFP